MSASESPDEIIARIKGGSPTPLPRPAIAIAISGGRDYTPSSEEMDSFWERFHDLGGTELHHGNAPGVDRFVVAAVQKYRPDIRVVAHPADWAGEGRKAGPLRNRAMMTRCRALIAFPGGKGTDSCIREARRQGKAVFYI